MKSQGKKRRRSMLLEAIGFVKQNAFGVRRPEWDIDIKALGDVVKARWAS